MIIDTHTHMTHSSYLEWLDKKGGASAIRCAYEVFGADQLLFATDARQGPATGEVRLATYPGVIKCLGLPERDNRKIFADNARRILI